MNHIEAMKLALEALEGLMIGREAADCYEANTAITAIKEAFAQPQQEPVACVIDGDLYFRHEIDWEDLAYQGHGIDLLYTSPPAQTDWEAVAADQAMTIALLKVNQPAQRKPLTDDEIWREYKFLWPFHPAEEGKLASDILMFARAIEAAHDIKENT